MVSHDQTGSHDNNEETIRDEVCAVVHDDQSTTNSSVMTPNKTQESNMNFSYEELMQKDSQIFEQGAPRYATENQNCEKIDENLVENSLNELKPSAFEEVENASELNSTCCDDNELEPHGYCTSSAFLSGDASNSSSEATTGSPTDIHSGNNVKNFDSINHQLKLDDISNICGLPVVDPAASDHVINTSLASNDLSDDEDLEEFLIKPMN